MNTVDRIKLIRAIFPDSREDVLVKRLQKFNEIVSQNKEKAMPGKNQDYRTGYDIGAYAAAEGEDLDPKDLDQLANELLDELDYAQLQVTNPEYFKDGVYTGYVITSGLEDEEE